MEFQLNIHYIAANEGGLNTFLVFVKDNYAAEVAGVSANSKGLKCQATLVFLDYSNMVAAVIAFKGQFAIEYNMQGNP